MNDDLVATYCNCMEDVKRRLAVVNTVTKGNLSTRSKVLDYEFVAVQLRKSLELVAFASMVANKKLYAEAHAKFAKHWRVNDMLDNLGKLHPGFYPKPITLDHVKDSGVKHFEYIKDGYLTQEDFVTLYNLCSEVMHTWNPFTNKERRIDFKRSVAEWAQRIERLLRLHRMRFIDREEIWLVDMGSSGGEKVRAFTAEPS